MPLNILENLGLSPLALGFVAVWRGGDKTPNFQNFGGTFLKFQNLGRTPYN